jgi:hypothetical protein
MKRYQNIISSIQALKRPVAEENSEYSRINASNPPECEQSTSITFNFCKRSARL